MPSVNVTVQDYSPLISYSPVGAWRAGSIDTDAFYNFYDDGFTVSSSINATATFHFNGTGVWIYGAKRPNHGVYTTLLDGIPTLHNGTSLDQFQTLLFGVAGLENGEHTIQLINTEEDSTKPFLDLDFITWQSDHGTEDDTLEQTYFGIDDQSWTFGPSWNMVDEPESLTGKLSSCNIPGARAGISFYGSSIEVYGSTGKECGEYQVTLDEETLSHSLSCYNTQNHLGVLLYSTTVNPGNHSLKIINMQAQGHTKIALDYAVVSSLKSAEETTKGDGSSNNLSLENGSNGSNLSPSIKAGIISACVGVFLLAILVGGFIYYLRNRRNVNVVRPATERRVRLSFDIENMKPHDLRDHPLLAAALKATSSDALNLQKHPLAGSRARSAIARTTSPMAVVPLYPENILSRGNTTIYTVSRSATRRAAKQETLTSPLVRGGGEALRVLIPPTGDRARSHSPSTPYAPRTSHPPRLFGSSTRPETEMANGPQLEEFWVTRGYEKASLDLAFRHPPPDYWHAMSQSAGHIDK